MNWLLAGVLVFFSPHGGCEGAVIKEVAKAREEILIQAYFMTSIPIIQAIERRPASCSLKCIFDKGQFKVTQHALTGHNWSVLLDGSHPISHNKLIIIDRKTVISGSYNYTNRAESNAENLVIIHDARIATKFVDNWTLHASHSIAP